MQASELSLDSYHPHKKLQVWKQACPQVPLASNVAEIMTSRSVRDTVSNKWKRTRWRVIEEANWCQHLASTCMGALVTGLAGKNEYILMRHQISLRLSDCQKNGSKYVRISSYTSFWESELLKSWGTSVFGTYHLEMMLQCVRWCYNVSEGLAGEAETMADRMSCLDYQVGESLVLSPLFAMWLH